MASIKAFLRLHFEVDDIFAIFKKANPCQEMFIIVLLFTELIFQTYMYYAGYAGIPPMSILINISVLLSGSPFSNLIVNYTLLTGVSNMVYLRDNPYKMYVYKMLYSYVTSSPNIITTILALNVEKTFIGGKLFYAISKQVAVFRFWIMGYVLYKLYCLNLESTFLVCTAAHAIMLLYLCWFCFNHMLDCCSFMLTYFLVSKEILKTINRRLYLVILSQNWGRESIMPATTRDKGARILCMARQYRRFALVWKCFNIFLAQFMRANLLFSHWILKHILYFSIIHAYMTILLLFDDSIKDEFTYFFCLGWIVFQGTLILIFHFFMASFSVLSHTPVKHCFSALSRRLTCLVSRLFQLERSLIMLNTKNRQIGVHYGVFGLVTLSIYCKFILFYTRALMKCYNIRNQSLLESLHIYMYSHRNQVT